MKKKTIVEKGYRGYFLMDSGVKIPFDISEEDGGENFSISLYGNSIFPFEKGEVIWLGEGSNLKLLSDRIIGWDMYEYEK